MKNNNNKQHHDGYSYDQSDYKKYDDFSILEPTPDIDLNLPDDDDDEISDYTLMDQAYDLE